MNTKEQNPTKRLAQTYRFQDSDMDLFFVGALSWAPSGGLDLGQAFYIASKIKDGDADSWVKSFTDYGQLMNNQADQWLSQGWQREAGEMRLKAAASFRSAWQFAPVGDVFMSIYTKEKQAFRKAMQELNLPATFFEVPYSNKTLPGMFLQNSNKNAPVILVIGGADTGFEDLFLTVGRSFFDRGYSVAMVDLPGQGDRPSVGLHWEAESEKSISAIVDYLVRDFGAVSGRIALLGLSLGGYFVTRAAGYESRFGAVIASTPWPRPGEMFAASAKAAAARGKTQQTASSIRNMQVFSWKMGAETQEQFLKLGAAMIADSERVSVPFLSVVGGGEAPIFRSQAHQWNESIKSKVKKLVELDESTGADGHCQVNNRIRLVQEVCGWLKQENLLR